MPTGAAREYLKDRRSTLILLNSLFATSIEIRTGILYVDTLGDIFDRRRSAGLEMVDTLPAEPATDALCDMFHYCALVSKSFQGKIALGRVLKDQWPRQERTGHIEKRMLEARNIYLKITKQPESLRVIDKLLLDDALPKVPDSIRVFIRTLKQARDAMNADIDKDVRKARSTNPSLR